MSNNKFLLDKDGEPIPESVVATLIAKGYTPHTKPVPMTQGMESWWEKTPINQINWPTAAALMALMFWVLVLLKGWP